MFVLPGDFYHTNENFPWQIRSYSRHRCYIKGTTVVRYEITKDVHRYFSDKDAWNTKLFNDFSSPVSKL